MFPRPVRDIVRPVRPDVGAGAKKFAQHTKNGPKWVLYGALGEPLRGNAAGGAVRGEFFHGPALAGPRRASLLRRAPGSRAHLLAPLTPQCAAKPHWWHGGQPAQAATYRVNLRIKGPRPPSIGLTCAVTSARATTTTNQSNFARNSPPHISNFEIGPLELQRLWAISKNDRVKLRATFAGTVTAVTLGPLYRPREPRPGLATTNSFTKNRNHHEDLQSAAPRPHGPLQNAPPLP